MPDRDIVHPSLSRIYQKAYRQICEGHDPPEEQARVLSKALRQNLQDYGNEHLRSLDDICQLLNDITSQPLFLPFENWNKRNLKIERLIRKMGGHPRGIALLREAVKDFIHEIRNGGHTGNDRREILSRYIERVCNADFVERVPLNQKHYNDISQQDLNERIKKLRPFLARHIKTYADKIDRTGNTNSLPVPKHQKIGKPFDIHADIFKL